MNKNQGIIYMIRNKLNDKIYIGQTRLGLERRLRGHIRDMLKGSKLVIHNAIRKYGVENFEIKVICTTNNVESLDELEKYYIRSYKSFIKQGGYNLTLGGDGCSGSDQCNKPVLQYNLDGILVKEWTSIKSAAKVLGLDRPSISNCCGGKKFKQVGGYIWRHKICGFKENLDISIEYREKYKANPVLQYDLDGNLIREYDSANIASKESGINITTILRSCKGITRLPKKFIWRFKDKPMLREDTPKYVKRAPDEENMRKLKKSVSKITLQYNLEGTLIKEHASATDAAKEVGAHYDSIYRACCGRLKTVKGFIWKYKEKDKEV